MRALRFQQTAPWFVAAIVMAILASGVGVVAGAETAKTDNLTKANLVAWCIVPFDAKHRGPAERAEMLKRLGLRRVGYDWRKPHVATFEQEILEYKKHDLEFFIFWDWHPEMVPLVKKHRIHPQFWLMMPNQEAGSQEEKVAAAGKALLRRSTRREPSTSSILPYQQVPSTDLWDRTVRARPRPCD